MPDPKDNAKASGDVHPPELDDDQAGNPGAAGSDLEDEGRAGQGINQAGYLKDKEAPGKEGSERS